jgi:serine/threonine-protein kinase
MPGAGKSSSTDAVTRRRVAALFEQAIELVPDERAAWIVVACAGDAVLQAELERLLHADKRAARFLERPPALIADAIAESASAPLAKPPHQFGPYRVLRSIGVGGMGEVWLAERSDGQFEQRVAIKQLAYPTPGLLQRFRQERQILARLEHANVAHLIDGGVDAAGAPYLVMEYVEGVPITEYAREQALDLRARLDLFLCVCEGVQYAHQNLVVHRDLKPSNIFVTVDGVPKLLDFGIAKVLATTDEAAATQTVARLLTPDYAAPEQFSGGAITTATDVYALGVVLYELLADARPPRSTSAAASAVGAASEPPPPSAAIDRTTGYARRRALRGDLDRIVLTALAHEPGHRYPSAEALAADIRRYLSGRPIAARGHSAWYRFRKYAGRNRYALAAAVLAFVVCLAAAIVSLHQARVAHEQAKKAEQQAARAEAVQTFLADLFRANTSKQGDPVKARETSARELLDLGAQKIATSMNNAPVAKLGVVSLLGDLYDDLAMDDEAVRLHRQGVDLARKLHGDDSPELVQALISLAGSMHASHAVNESGAILSEASAILDRRQDFSSLTRGVLLNKQAEHYNSSDIPRALDYARQSIQVLERLQPSTDLAEATYMRGLIEQNSGLFQDATVSFSRAIEVSRAVDGDPNPSLPRFYAYLGEAQSHQLDFRNALNSGRRAMEAAIKVNGEEHVDTLQSKMRFGSLLVDVGETREGLALLDDAKRIAIKIRGLDDPFHTTQARFGRGYALARVGRLSEGLADMQAAIENRRVNRPGTNYLGVMLEQSAGALIEMGRVRQAQAQLDESAGIYRKVGVTPHSRVYNFLVVARIRLALSNGKATAAKSLLDDFFVDGEHFNGVSATEIDYWLLSGEVNLAAGETKAAMEYAQRVRSALEHADLTKYMKSSLTRADFTEGVATLKAGRAQDALPLLQRAVETRQEIFLPESPKIAEAQIALAECLAALGESAEAKGQLAAARAIMAAQNELAPAYRLALQTAGTRLTSKGPVSAAH